MSFGSLPSTTAIQTCCQEVIPGDFISIPQLVSRSFAGLSGGAAQTVGTDHPEHPASQIPQRHVRTGSSKLGCCRRNPPKRHFREGRSSCRDTPVIPRDAAPSAGREERKEWGVLVVPMKWGAMATHRADGRGFVELSSAAGSSPDSPGSSGVLWLHGPGIQPGSGAGECSHGAGMKVGFTDNSHHGHEQSGPA